MLAIRMSKSPHSVLRFVSLASLLLLLACGDDPVTRPGTGRSDDKASDGNADDDAEDSSDSDDDGTDTGKLDGGKADAGKLDAGKTDAGKTDAGKTDAGTSDSSTPSEPEDLDAGSDAAAHDAAAHDAATDAAIGNDASTGGDAATGGDAGATLPPDPGKVPARDVVTLGDSWMSNTLNLISGTGGGLSPSLRRASGQSYPNYAVQGVMLLQRSTFGAAIPTQWDDAVRDNRSIKTVLMTAGGNDIIQDSGLQADCAAGGAECKAKLAEIGAALKTLWGKMAAAGVKDIIHIAYARSAGEGVADADENDKNLAELCAAVPAPTRCRIFKTDTLVGSSGISIDGIHPTRAANDRMAEALYKLMEAEHIAR